MYKSNCGRSLRYDSRHGLPSSQVGDTNSSDSVYILRREYLGKYLCILQKIGIHYGVTTWFLYRNAVAILIFVRVNNDLIAWLKANELHDL